MNRDNAQRNALSERPLLLLPEATSAARGQRGGGGDGPASPGRPRQQERLGPRLQELEEQFEARRVQLQTSAVGAVPEDVLVLETAGRVDDFIKAVRRVEGFEFLAEYDEENVPATNDFYRVSNGERVGYTGRVYLLFSNQAAFRQLLQLWQAWLGGQSLGHGRTRWRDVFDLLRNIRPWDVRDRLEETGVLADWADRVARADEVIPCEIELWFRENEARRNEAARELRSQVQQFGGTVLSEAAIVGIRYHAMSVRLPIQTVQQLLDERTRNTIRFVQSEQIQYVRAAGQMVARAAGEKRATSLGLVGPQPSGDPAVALLDALPLQGHAALVGRLLVDDPDEFEAGYTAAARSHGTGMASLIVWGDLNSDIRQPIPQPLYVRPIMRPVFPPENWPDAEVYEQVPDGVLVVDLIHRAVRRLFEGDGTEVPAAPSVRVINLSLGIRDRPFAGTLSPLARLLDWLAWRYQVLFVVSAGNHLEPIEIGSPWSELGAMAAEAMAGVVINALASDTRNRRLLSPAEAMNALTVGALHDDEDAAAAPAGTRVDVLPVGYPSPFNGHGLGYRRSVKPDVLLPGGRIQFTRPVMGHERRLKPVRVPAAPGHEVAAPGPAGDSAHTSKARGTSNAAALLSRSAAFLVPFLAELRSREEGRFLADVPDGVLLKTLLAHGARWGELGGRLTEHFQSLDDSDRLKEQLSRLLGYGRIDVVDVAQCSSTRVTAVGGGLLGADAGAEHRFPLPPSLSGKRGTRRLAVTLGWFTPIHPLSHRWRQAHLWFETPKSKLNLSRMGPDWQASQRGTLQHNLFEGESASAFVDGDDVVILVSCREDAPQLEGSIPYAVAVTLEVGAEVGIDVYTEVRERLTQRLRVQPRAGG